MVASRREINFARQLFRIRLFIFTVQQNFCDPLTERLRCEIALDSTPMANGNSACLFGDDHSDGIRFFSYAETRTVTQSEAAVQRFSLTHRKNAGCSCNSSVAKDHSAIVQCGLWMKDGQDKLDRKLAVNYYTCFFVNAD